MSTSSTKASTSKRDVNVLFVLFPSFHQNYLSSRGKTWRDLLQESLQALQQGNYYLSGELSPSLLSCGPHCHIKRKRVVISCPSLSQIVASLPMPSCASAAACEHSKSWPTSTDRTSLHLNCQVRQDKMFLIQTFLIPFQLFRGCC